MKDEIILNCGCKVLEVKEDGQPTFWLADGLDVGVVRVLPEIFGGYNDQQMANFSLRFSNGHHDHKDYLLESNYNEAAFEHTKQCDVQNNKTAIIAEIVSEFYGLSIGSLEKMITFVKGKAVTGEYEKCRERVFSTREKAEDYKKEMEDVGDKNINIFIVEVDVE